MSVVGAIIIGSLIAMGIILIFSFLNWSTLKQKIRDWLGYDPYKAKIKKELGAGDIPIVTVDVYDSDGNYLDEKKYAALDGTSLRSGETYYRWEN